MKLSAVNSTGGVRTKNTIDLKGKSFGTIHKDHTESLGNRNDMSGWTIDGPFPPPHSKQIEGMKEMFFSRGALHANATMGPEVQAIEKEIDRVANDYFKGNISSDDLAQTFQTLANRFLGTCKSNGYPNSLLADSVDEIALSAFYDSFRQRLLQSAARQNFDEGRQHITGEMNSQRNWRYYNSDYYFKSEDAIAVITNKVENIASDMGLDQFEIPDYKALGKNSMLNFNAVVSGASDTIPGGLTMAEQNWMIDFDQVPPEHFQWFYQSGGNTSGEAVLLSVTVGEETHLMDYSHFDPSNPLTATTWASFVDSNGKKHMISSDFNFNHTAADLRTLSELLKFTGKNDAFSSANKFMSNFKVFPKGYLQRTLADKRWDAQA